MFYSLDACKEAIQNFKPSLTVETQVFVDGSRFVIRYGEPSQMKLWAVGTLNPLDSNTTQVDIEIGLDRAQSNLKYVVGLSAVVWMMALLEGLTDELAWNDIFIVAGLFAIGFWILLGLGMAYTQHRFRHDLIHTMCGI